MEAAQVGDASAAALHRGKHRLNAVGEPPPHPREPGVQRFSARQPLVVLSVRVSALSLEDVEMLEALALLAESLIDSQEREDVARREQTLLRQKVWTLETAARDWEQRRARAAHDLRTPLSVVKGYVDMMLRGMAGPVSPSMQRFLERMTTAVRNQDAIIDKRLSRTVKPPVDLSALVARHLRHASADYREVLPEGPAWVRAEGVALRLLLRTLERSLLGVRPAILTVTLAQDAVRPLWTLEVVAASERLLEAKALKRLEVLALRLGAPLELSDDGDRLRLTLPAAS